MRKLDMAQRRKVLRGFINLGIVNLGIQYEEFIADLFDPKTSQGFHAICQKFAESYDNNPMTFKEMVGQVCVKCWNSLDLIIPRAGSLEFMKTKLPKDEDAAWVTLEKLSLLAYFSRCTFAHGGKKDHSALTKLNNLGEFREADFSDGDAAAVAKFFKEYKDRLVNKVIDNGYHPYNDYAAIAAIYKLLAWAMHAGVNLSKGNWDLRLIDDLAINESAMNGASKPITTSGIDK